jgi:hypothetical protein
MAKPKKPLPYPTASTKVLSNNIAVWDTPNYWENTCRALPPSPIYPHGMIVLLPGQWDPKGYLETVITRPIYDATGKVDLNVSSSVEHTLQNPACYLAAHTDNHIVRHKDGSFIVMKACFNWTPVNNPKPWQQFPQKDNRNLPDPQIGGRGTNVIWRGYHQFGRQPSPLGQMDWILKGVADPFVFNGGKYGYPQALDSSGKRLTLDNIDEQASWWCPGSDRPELYACPFTGYLYLTAVYDSGAYQNEDSSVQSEKFHDVMLLYSPNQGKDWYVLKDNFGGSVPLVMTSTPNGRLFLYHWAGGAGELFCSNIFNAAAGEVPKITSIYGQEEHEVGDSQNGYRLEFNESMVAYTETVNGKLLNEKPPDPYMTSGAQTMSHPSISRVSTDTATSRVRVSVLGLNEHYRNRYAIIDIGVIDKDGLPHLEPGSLKRAGKLEARDPVNHSVLHGTFIDPDYISMPDGFVSNTSLFYWLEWPRLPRGQESVPENMSAHYCFLHGWPSHQSTVGPLSVTNGALRTWKSRDPGGHYMTGGFYYWKGQNYVAQWREPDGIRANIVSVPTPILPMPVSNRIP